MIAQATHAKIAVRVKILLTDTCASARTDFKAMTAKLTSTSARRWCSAKIKESVLNLLQILL